MAAGNIGMPLADVALRDRRPDWVALEISSFQLHDTPSINPVVGVVTNLSADHLDRYASVDDYFADKAMLFRNAHDRSKWVLNADDDAVMHLAERRPSTPPRGGRRVQSDDRAPATQAGDGTARVLSWDRIKSEKSNHRPRYAAAPRRFAKAAV